MIGRRLAHYEIVEKLGAGGMGEVFKARDTRLERFVALKVLPPDKIADVGRKERFMQEARAASALNHPNIVTIYDIPEEGGVLFLVMEYVPGKPLDEVIPRKGMGVSAVLKYAVQIAGALAAAHAARIVHRDIKPSNIMVGENGRVKVLDFGLAKLLEPAVPAAPDDATRAAAVMTEEGLVVGSAAYMSPEQAEGKSIDARSDIFSFGAVLYEMVTGQRAFPGETWASTIAAVLKTEPPPPQGLPRELQRVITRCLRKDRDRRSQSIAEIKLELEEMIEESDSGTLMGSTPAAAPQRQRSNYLAFAVALAAVAAAGALWFFQRERHEPQTAYQLRQITRGDGINVTPALSPDGKLLAYASNRGGDNNLDIWVQQVAGGDAIRLTRHRAVERWPQFSPDGGQLLFVREGDGIYAIPSLGGVERLLAKGSREGEYSPDGKWIAYTTGFPGSRELFGLYVMPAQGGAPRKIETGLASFYGPRWSPDSQRLLLRGNETVSYGGLAGELFLYAIPVEGGKAARMAADADLRKVGLRAFLPVAWQKDGKIVGSAIHGGVRSTWLFSMDRVTGALRGSSQRVTAGSGEFPGPPSLDGRIPYSTGTGAVSLYRMNLDAGQGKSPGDLTPVVTDGASVRYPNLTSDGSKLVYVSDRSGSDDIWLKDFSSGAETPLVASQASERRGLISPDGSQLVFLRTEKGKLSSLVWPMPAGPERKLCEKCDDFTNLSILNWAPDGKSVVIATGDPQRFDALNVASGKSSPLAAHSKYPLHDGVVSPNGRWIAIKLVTSASIQPLFIAPVGPAYAAEKDWIRVTPDSYNAKPFWGPGGDILYYYSSSDNFQCLYAQRLGADMRPQGAAFAVRHFHEDLQVADGAAIGYGLAPGYLYLPLANRRSNIWLAEPEK
ncbi:MAG TPA: protein kinase [Bryobacteraceae bacterium]|nr:protein kinase [Bryobacteraceae bacterium]